jgi:hypothetical protein
MVFAGLTGLVAVFNVIGIFAMQKPESAMSAGYLMGRITGNFLVPVGLLIAGLILWRKSKSPPPLPPLPPVIR